MTDSDYTPEPESGSIARYKCYVESQLSKAKSGDVYAIDECLKIFGEKLDPLYDEKTARDVWSALKVFSKIDNSALYLLGVRNLFGHPFGRQESKGVAQIMMAAERGNKAARYDIALWHIHGVCGVPKNKSTARNMLGQLAEEGVQDAKEMLDALNHGEKLGHR